MSFKVASGILLKQSSNGLTWNRRYFVLSQTELSFFDGGMFSFTAPATRQNAKPKATASLAGASITNTKSVRAGKFAFRLNHGRGKWVLSGSTLAETLEWVAALESVGVTSSFDASHVSELGHIEGLAPPLQDLSFALPGGRVVHDAGHHIRAERDPGGTSGGPADVRIGGDGEARGEQGETLRASYPHGRRGQCEALLFAVDSIADHLQLFVSEAAAALTEPRLAREKGAVVLRLVRGLCRATAWHPEAWIRLQTQSDFEAAAHAVLGDHAAAAPPPLPQRAAAAAGPTLHFAYTVCATGVLWVGVARALLQLLLDAVLARGGAIGALAAALGATALVTFAPYWCLLGVPPVALRCSATLVRGLLVSIAASCVATSLNLAVAIDAATRGARSLAPRTAVSAGAWLPAALPLAAACALQACLALAAALLVARHAYVQLVLYTEAAEADDEAAARQEEAAEEEDAVRRRVAARQAARKARFAASPSPASRRPPAGRGPSGERELV